MFSFESFCPVCSTHQTMKSHSEWFRDFLVCPNCGSSVRERGLALVMNEILPNWRKLQIHESSPSPSGLSRYMAAEAPGYVPTHYFPDRTPGETCGSFRNENLEQMTFNSATFDLTITLDVMEHVFNPERVYLEVWRTLKPRGYYVHTFPIRKWLVTAVTARALLKADGEVEQLVEVPEYHGNPIDERGALVTIDYGYDIGDQIAKWAPFDVRICRFADQTHGILGEYTEVIVCRKRE
ncbi:methyltransferase domain-containing protein [Methylocystis rosea]|uniref:Methyltransferase domain-containing protein n=2 Tax=Methylocystis rosea TaxID=173366 RepID=A0A3G8MA01_9HYPH|nr:methyltransferase domain-containing protein [Methylocystis rosea]